MFLCVAHTSSSETTTFLHFIISSKNKNQNLIMLNKYRIQLLEKPTVVLFSSKCLV